MKLVGKTFSSVLMGATLLLMAPLPSSGQDRAGSFGDVVDVKVVNVEAVVTDRSGQRVAGLGPDDFVLTVDGLPVPIDYFTEVRGGRAVSAGAGSAAAIEATRTGEPVRNNYLVFVDDYFTLAPQRDAALEWLERDLPLLGPEDRMAIVAFDGRRLEMLSSWSGSTGELSRAIERAKARPAFGLQRTSVRLRRGIPDASPAGFVLYDMEADLERTVRAVNTALRGFAGPSGRKVLLLLTGPWPSFEISPFRGSLPGVADTDLEVVQPLIATANLVGYTVYPVDLSDLLVDGGAERATPPPALRGRSTRDLVRQSTLRVAARDTGGEALFYAARQTPLQTVARDVDTYYWLGFAPRRQGDDLTHRVRVELRRPGLEVRARRSYLDLSRDAELAMLAQSAAVFGGGAETADLGVRVGSAVRSGLRRLELPVDLTIPATALTFVAVGDELSARAEVRLAAIDERGDQADVVLVPVDFRRSQRPAPGDLLRYELSVRLRREPHDLVVTVHDPLSGTMLLRRVSVLGDQL